MINCHPYQKTFTQDLQNAYRERNDAFFHREIKRLCSMVVNRPNNFDNGTKYDHITSRLQLCLALVDSLVRHGDTTKLVNDVVNF